MCWLILILQRSVFQSKGEREENVFIKYTSALQRNRTKGLFMAALKQSLGECNNELAFTMWMCAAFTSMLALAEGSTFFSPHFCGFEQYPSCITCFHLYTPVIFQMSQL